MAIQVLETTLKDARVFVPDVFGDDRGFFKEAYSAGKYQALGVTEQWVQDNVSYSLRNTVRGLHGDRRMAKLVQVLKGWIWDVIVDLREGSPTYRKWEAFELRADNHHQLYVPPGFLHGFLALDETGSIVTYKQSALYDPAQEFAVNWRDPALDISWPLVGEPRISAKDAAAPCL
jgi:dTDP-4-dehydrorhamnose 3,5-epimerase